MKVFRGFSSTTLKRPIALAIGNFDGVHLGHQALLKEVCAAAEQYVLCPTVMTFEPHPREFFARQKNDLAQAPARIGHLRDNMYALHQTGIHQVVIAPFNTCFASQTAEAFVEAILVRYLRVKWLMVGEDFCFGAGRSGNVALLKAMGARYGFIVKTLPTVTYQGRRISSSSVREALSTGDFLTVRALLGRAYWISGRVIHGKKIGRTIGFPTLNVRMGEKRFALSGVFVVRVHGLSAQPLQGVASLGVRPTVEDAGRILLEVYVFNYDEDCYGRLVQIECIEKIRDEKKFDHMDDMVARMHEDVSYAVSYFNCFSSTF